MKSLFFSTQQCRQSNQSHGKSQNSQNQINQKSVSHIIYFLNKILKDQNTIAVTKPNNTSIGLNLSSRAGKTTEAKETKATSDAISESFSICFLLKVSNFIRTSYLEAIFLSTGWVSGSYVTVEEEN